MSRVSSLGGRQGRGTPHSLPRDLYAARSSLLCFPGAGGGFGSWLILPFPTRRKIRPPHGDLGPQDRAGVTGSPGIGCFPWPSNHAVVWEESQGSDGQASGGLRSHEGQERPRHLVQGQPNWGPEPTASAQRHHTRVSPSRPAHPGRDSCLQMSGIQGPWESTATWQAPNTGPPS